MLLVNQFQIRSICYFVSEIIDRFENTQRAIHNGQWVHAVFSFILSVTPAKSERQLYLKLYVNLNPLKHPNSVPSFWEGPYFLLFFKQRSEEQQLKYK